MEVGVHSYLFHIVNYYMELFLINELYNGATILKSASTLYLFHIVA